jgi:hypothetical protein
MKILLDYIRSWFISKPIAETEKEEENYFLIN